MIAKLSLLLRQWQVSCVRRQMTYSVPEAPPVDGALDGLIPDCWRPSSQTDGVGNSSGRL